MQDLGITIRTVLLAAIIAMGVGGAAVAGPFEDAVAAEAIVEKIGNVVRAEIQRQKVPGAAVAVVHKGQVLVAEGYGLADVEHNVPVTSGTIFQSGSVGKQFTAVAVMLQVEDGKLSLDDSIATYFPDSPPGWRSVRVRNLLTHTSGIPDFTQNDLNNQRNYTEDDIVRIAKTLPLEFEPGSRWRYSNTGYKLLGVLVHKVSGRFYGDVLKDRVFAPLGMKTARTISEEDIVPNRAAGYRLVKGELKNQVWVSPTVNTLGDGTLYLTVHDFIAWDKALRAGAILKPQSWAEVYTPVKLNSGKSYPYGFGWFIEEAGGQRWHHHYGAWQGFRTFFSRYLGDDLTIVVLANRANTNLQGIAQNIAVLFNQKLARPTSSSPIPDKNPAVTQRVRAMMEKASVGRLFPSDLPYAPHGFFPERVTRYEELLHPLGAPQRIDLLERRDSGDDQLYTYSVAFGEHTLIVQFGLSSDNRVSQFDIRAAD